ncbi:MAG: alpha/beta fold hydrolase, partial [Myxococcales bacterium]
WLPIAAPTQVIWGQRDRYLAPELAAPDPQWVPDQRVLYIPGASHWVQADAPERVNEALIEFLRPLRG